MAIPVICTCGHQFKAKDELLGKSVRCPACKAAVRVADPAGSPDEPEPSEPKRADRLKKPRFRSKAEADQQTQRRERRGGMLLKLVGGVFVLAILGTVGTIVVWLVLTWDSYSPTLPKARGAVKAIEQLGGKVTFRRSQPLEKIARQNFKLGDGEGGKLKLAEVNVQELEIQWLRVDLANTAATDADVPHILDLPSGDGGNRVYVLHEIVLTNTQVTDQGVAEIRKQVHPKCTIVR